uniref:Uncharacterized protein AlNc14C6G819 n=1 Tax=Albugo laibachii Nc14 TaxID=890382 RepID=F0W140_9STRA|nr:conserved hypothetical protein [Albugo laibachii Nc14]|eukprot:CCA14764.1 conserved hypothetical protein [Albugo laibachii Nc14]
MVDDDNFIISEWFNAAHSKLNVYDDEFAYMDKLPVALSNQSGKHKNSNTVDINKISDQSSRSRQPEPCNTIDLTVKSAEEAPTPTFCFVCNYPDPEYMSTNLVQSAPSVPVCSVNCESVYLAREGYTAPETSRKRQRRENEPKTLSTALITNARSWWMGALSFYDFIYQRHGMWHCYTMGCNQPKVDDCLQQYWTWNVYRLLDRSTAYLRKHVVILQKTRKQLSLREVLWMAVVFRFCNNLENIDTLGGIPATEEFDRFKVKVLEKGIQTIERGWYTDGSITMTDFLDVIQAFLKDLDVLAARIGSCTSVEEAFRVLSEFQNNALGACTCWQVIADLLTFELLTRIEDTNDFVWLSEDAKASLVHIYGKHRARSSHLVDLAKTLQKRQVQGFKALNVTFPYFQGQKLDLIDIAHALHGFNQYRSIKQYEQAKAEGTAHAIPRLYNSRSYFLDAESCSICSNSENDEALVLCDLCHRIFHKYCINLSVLPLASWICTSCTSLYGYPNEGEIAGKEVIEVD